jgi:release factor glutamine methyltransferase
VNRVETARDLEHRVRTALRGGALATADVESRWIVAEATGDDHPFGGEPVSERFVRAVDEMVARRLAGEPLQYVLGSWSFREHELLVDRRVLIPRPETETTAQVAIDEAARLGARTGPADPWAGGEAAYAVADLGTGSGAIAIALVAELPEAEVWATDVSDDALAVARANLAGAGSTSTRVRLASGSWFDALPADLRGRLRLVVSNPPYIAESEVDDLAPEVARHEPRLALVSGPTGLEAIEHLVTAALDWLEPTGVLVVELAPHQADDALRLASAAGYGEVRVERDLAGRDRVLVARSAAAI